MCEWRSTITIKFATQPCKKISKTSESDSIFEEMRMNDIVYWESNLIPLYTIGSGEFHEIYHRQIALSKIYSEIKQIWRYVSLNYCTKLTEIVK